MRIHVDKAVSISKAYFYFAWLFPKVGIALLIFLSACKQQDIAVVENQQENPYFQREGVAEVVEAVCDKQVVMLGEGSNHGQGTTQSFKGDLIKALVKTCDFELVLFEASFYEFVRLNEIQNANVEVSTEDIRAALGYFWGYNLDILDMVNFLKNAFNSKEVQIGGIDDPIGGPGQNYSNFEMPAQVLPTLPIEESTDCVEALEKRILWRFPSDKPYDVVQKKQLLNCLLPIKDSESLSNSVSWNESMRASLHRHIQRDFLSKSDRISGRAESMYENFEFWLGLSSSIPKTIIWSSSAHAAKSKKILGDSETAPNFGAKVKSQFGGAAFSLGFSSLKGAYTDVQGIERPVPQAVTGSLEKEAFSEYNGDTVFLSTNDLGRLGTRSGWVRGKTVVSQDWSLLFDGLVVFRQQEPAIRDRPNPKK
ncbi:erythromycin esterase family protein [Hellea sp.]|nr:erythromycin esterase family protein [Hellea sp.]